MMCLLHLFAVAHPGASRSSFKEKRPTWVAKDFSLSWMNASIEPTPPSLERGHDTQVIAGFFGWDPPKGPKYPQKKMVVDLGLQPIFGPFLYTTSLFKTGWFPPLLARLLVKIPFGQVPHLLCFLPKNLDHQPTKPWEKKKTKSQGFLSAQHLNIRKIIRISPKVKWCQVKIIIFVPKKSSENSENPPKKVKWTTPPRDFKGKPSGSGRSPAFAVAPKAWSNGTPVSPASPAIDRMATESQASTTWRRFLDFWISGVSGFLDFWMSGCNPKSSWTPKQYGDFVIKNGTKWFNRTIKMGLIVSYWCDSCL